MTSQTDSARCDNPFSTRHVRPGALPFHFPPGESVAAILQRFQSFGWRGQIVGPHGSGKSTLLASLLPVIERAGSPVRAIALHDGQRRLPQAFLRNPNLASGTVLVIDGYEQLSYWSRLRLRRLCRRRGLGLLVTAHSDVGLPSVFETAVDVTLAQHLVAQLLNPKDTSLFGPQEIAAKFTSHEGNIREVLFDLYDLYQQRRRGENA